MMQQPTTAEIRAELDQVLGSQELSGSTQRRSFLKYVVEETLAGRGGRLKERNIAIKALGRDHSFNSRVDCVVRMAASRLRRALDRYYAKEGAGNAVRISIPKGGYEPVVSYQDAGPNRHVWDVTDSTCSEVHASGCKLPVVAVTPWLLFTDFAQEHFLADSIAQDVAIGLSGTGLLEVVDYSAARSQTARGHTAVETASRLQADYVVTGTVRQKESDIRLTTQLLNVSNGAILWADTSDFTARADALLSCHDSTVRHIVDMIGDLFGVIGQALWPSVAGRPIEQLTSLEAVLYVCQHNCTLDDTVYRLAVEASERATRADPRFAWGWAARADVSLTKLSYLAPGSAGDSGDLGLYCVRRALRLDPTCSYAHWGMGWYHLLHGNLDESIAAAERTRVNANGSPFETGAAGMLMSLAGEHRRGQQFINEAIAGNPRLPGWLRWGTVTNHIADEDYAAALRVTQEFSLPHCFWDQMLRGAVLSRAGRTEEARTEVRRACELRPILANSPRRVVGKILHSDTVLNDLLDSCAIAGLSTK